MIENKTIRHSVRLRNNCISKPEPKSANNLKKCTKSVKTSKTKKKQLFVCDVIGCGKKFTNKQCFRYDLQTHSRQLGNRLTTYVCDFDGCGYEYPSKKHIEDHKNIHKGIKPHVCDSCGKAFTLRGTLRTHIKISHKLSNEVFLCNINDWNKRFKNEFTLKSHQRLIHSKEKPFVCRHPNCGKKFVYKHLLKHHSVMHSTDRPFVCTVEGCAKSYKVKDVLTEHMKSNHGSLEFRCSLEGMPSVYQSYTNWSELYIQRPVF